MGKTLDYLGKISGAVHWEGRSTMNKCLIVVDYQKDFVTGALGFEVAKTLDDGIAARIWEYHGNGDTVLFTLDTHDANYPTTYEGLHLPIPHCIKGTEGHTLFGKTGKAKKDSDLVFEKGTFGSEKLFAYLKNTPFESIEFCGVVSDICVISNVVLARTAQPETEVLVNSALIASNNADHHQAALTVMESLQVHVINGKGEKNG